jgi:hypothetical protein
LEEAWKMGCSFDAWTEHFDEKKWASAFETAGIDPDFYTIRPRKTEEVLPWDHIDVGVRRQHLLRERERACRAELSPDCRRQCSACGAAALLKEGRCDG